MAQWINCVTSDTENALLYIASVLLPLPLPLLPPRLSIILCPPLVIELHIPELTGNVLVKISFNMHSKIYHTIHTLFTGIPP